MISQETALVCVYQMPLDDAGTNHKFHSNKLCTVIQTEAAAIGVVVMVRKQFPKIGDWSAKMVEIANLSRLAWS